MGGKYDNDDEAIIDDDDNDGNNGDDVAYHSFQMSEEGAHTRVTSRGSVLGADCFKLYWAQKSRKEHLTKCCSVLRRVQTTTPEGLPRAGKSALFCRILGLHLNSTPHSAR